MLDWPFYAFLVSVFNAIIIQINHHYRFDGLTLSFYRSITGTLLFFPVLFFVEWPTWWVFYIGSIVIGLIMVMSDVIILNAAARFGGRLTSLYIAIKIICGFIVWSIIDPSSFVAIWENKLVFLGVLGCMFLSIWAISHMRKSDASWKAFLYVAPAGLILTVDDIITKFILERVELFSGSFIFAFVTVFSSVFFAGFALKYKHQDPFVYIKNKRMWQAASGIGISIFLLVFAINIAHALTPNPAYVNAVSLLSMVWIMGYHKLKGMKDDASPVAGLMFFIAAMGLVFLVG